MSTERQKQANRQNAKKSTGPRTEEGKARSSQNGLKHGLLARDAVMAGEDPAEYDRQLQQLEENIFPKNALEFELVRQVADAQWRLRRITRIEAGFVTDVCTRTSHSTRKHYPETILPDRDGENQLLGKSMQDRTQALANLARYHTHMSRNQLRALNMIRQLRADEARYRENIDPKTGAIHRPTLTDPDPYNTPDPMEPQPTRYEPPAAVAQTPGRPIGFRANTPSAARSADLGSEIRGLSSQPTTSAPPPRSAPSIGSWSAYEPLGPRHESRNTNHGSRLTRPSTPGRVAGTRRTQSRRSYLESMGWNAYEALRPRHESRNTKHEARLTRPSTSGRVAGTRRTQSRRSYLESMGWSAYEALRPRHESRNTNHETRVTPAAHAPSRAAAEAFGR